MTLFSGIPSDLCDAVAYELDAIEYLRTTLHEHDETPVGGVTLNAAHDFGWLALGVVVW